MQKRRRDGDPEWYIALKKALTEPNSTTLRKQVYPNADPIFIPTKHKVGSVVFLPKELNTRGYAPATDGYFFKVVGHGKDADSHPTCNLKRLTILPTQPKYATPHITTRFRAVTEHATVLWEDPAHPQETEAEIDLLPVHAGTQRVSTRYSPQGAVGRKHVAYNNQK